MSFVPIQRLAAEGAGDKSASLPVPGRWAARGQVQPRLRNRHCWTRAASKTISGAAQDDPVGLHAARNFPRTARRLTGCAMANRTQGASQALAVVT